MDGREFEILGTPLKEIEIGATGLREIAQNVKMIITTWRGEVFLDRNFGLDARVIDLPINLLHANIATDITQQIEQYEPRVEVTSVTLTESDAGDGKMIPLVMIRIKDGVLL